jgi:hypothetical protein
MTAETYKTFARRLSKPGVWVFPSIKNDGPRRTVQKSHERVTRGNKESEGIRGRLSAVRHEAHFATRFALAGGSLPVLAKILGHADLSLLMRYVHPSQHDMDRAMAWYSSTRVSTPEMESMLVESVDGGGPTFGPKFGPISTPNLAQNGLFQPNLEIETKRRPQSTSSLFSVN